MCAFGGPTILGIDVSLGGVACAIREDSSALCWGIGTYGATGQGNQLTLGDGAGEMAAISPISLGSGRTVIRVSSMGSGACALLDNGSVKCWGLNSGGALGQDHTLNIGDQSGEMVALAAINLGAGRTATKIASGTGHNCALLDNGDLKCWGVNNYAQLGQNSTVNIGGTSGDMAALSAINLGAGRTALDISAGIYHTCAILDDNTVKCWGHNQGGQLGQGNTTMVGSGTVSVAEINPVNLGDGNTAAQFSVGAAHSCVILAGADAGKAKCWGYGDNGALGRGNTAGVGWSSNPQYPLYAMFGLNPIDLGTGRTVTRLSAGTSFTCAILDNAKVKCWGANSYGQLGINAATIDHRGDEANEMGDNLPELDL